MKTIEEIGHNAYNEAFNNDCGRDIDEFARLYAEVGAENKFIDIDLACELLKKKI